MPTYQYACTECGHRFEAVQAFSDDALTQCPECGGKLRKVYGSVGVVFKGSGFYRTDSRSGSGSGSGSASVGASSGSSSESSGSPKTSEGGSSTKASGSESGSGSSSASSTASTTTKAAAS